jgi:RNase P/RNase MRP subunit POP5
MKLKPTLKVRKRYVVIQVLLANGTVGDFSKNDMIEALKDTMQEFFGTFTLAKAAPMILHKTFERQNQTIIIKINHTYVDQLKASLLFIKEINKVPVIVRSVIVSGTLKKTKSFEVKNTKEKVKK